MTFVCIHSLAILLVFLCVGRCTLYGVLYSSRYHTQVYASLHKLCTVISDMHLSYTVSSPSLAWDMALVINLGNLPDEPCHCRWCDNNLSASRCPAAAVAATSSRKSVTVMCATDSSRRRVGDERLRAMGAINNCLLLTSWITSAFNDSLSRSAMI